MIMAALAQESADEELDLDDFTLEEPAALEAPIDWESLVGVRVGPAFPLDSELVMAGMGWVDVGVSPPAAGGRLRGIAAVGFAAPRATGSVADEGLSESREFLVRQRALVLTAGLEVRLLQRSEAVTPVLSLAPAWVTAQTVVTGEGLVSARETRPVFGVRAGGGMEISSGPGAVALQLDYTAARLDGALTGEVPLRLLQPNISYRVRL